MKAKGRKPRRAEKDILSDNHLSPKIGTLLSIPQMWWRQSIKRHRVKLNWIWGDAGAIE